MTDYTQQLKDVPLFAGLSEPHLRRIATSGREHSYAPGAPIVSEGETGHGFYLIVRGSVEVQRTGRVITTLGPGEYFGELALLCDQPRSATVVAKEPTTCLMLARWDFRGIVEANPAMAVALLETVARRIQDAGGQ